jgi:hypothetical protein
MTDDRLSGLALIAGSGGTIITMSLHPTGRVAAAQVESMIHVLIAVHALALACVPIQFLGAWGLSRRVASPDRLAVAGLVLYTIWRSKLGVTKPSATAAFITASRANAFVHLVLSGLFDSTPSRNPLDPPRAKYPPYTHQVDMQ